MQIKRGGSAFIRGTRVPTLSHRVSGYNKREESKDTTRRVAASTQVRSMSLKSMVVDEPWAGEGGICIFVLFCLVLLWIYVGCAARRRAWVHKSRK